MHIKSTYSTNCGQLAVPFHPIGKNSPVFFGIGVTCRVALEPEPVPKAALPAPMNLPGPSDVNRSIPGEGAGR